MTYGLVRFRSRAGCPHAGRCRGQRVTVHCTGYGKNGDLSQKFWSTKDPGQVCRSEEHLRLHRKRTCGLFVWVKLTCDSLHSRVVGALSNCHPWHQAASLFSRPARGGNEYDRTNLATCMFLSIRPWSLEMASLRSPPGVKNFAAKKVPGRPERNAVLRRWAHSREGGWGGGVMTRKPAQAHAPMPFLLRRPRRQIGGE